MSSDQNEVAKLLLATASSQRQLQKHITNTTQKCSDAIDLESDKGTTEEDDEDDEDDEQQQPKRQKIASTEATVENAIRCYYAVRKGRYHKHAIFFDEVELNKEVEGFADAEYNVFFNVSMAASYIDVVRSCARANPKASEDENIVASSSSPMTKRTTNRIIAPKNILSNEETVIQNTNVLANSSQVTKKTANLLARKLPTSLTAATKPAPKTDHPNTKLGNAAATATNDDKSDLEPSEIENDMIMGPLPDSLDYDDVVAGSDEVQNTTTPGSVRTNRTRHARATTLTEASDEESSNIARVLHERYQEWDEMYKRLLIYERDHGDCNVSKEDDEELATWLSSQQQEYNIYKKNQSIGDKRKHSFTTLTAWRLQKLLDCCVEFTEPVLEEQEAAPDGGGGEEEKMKMFSNDNELQNTIASFRNELSNFMENKHSIEQPTRKRRRNNRSRTSSGGLKLTKEQKQRFANWDPMYLKLAAFHSEHGHSQVTNAQDDELARWIFCQRRTYGAYKTNESLPDDSPHIKFTVLTAERIQKLVDLGIDLSPKSPQKMSKRQRDRYESWDIMYQRLVVYKNEHGDCDVPHEKDAILSEWTHDQRKAYKVYKRNESLLDSSQHRFTILNPERVEKLLELGIDLSPKLSKKQKEHFENFDGMYEKLVAYKSEHGNCTVSSDEDLFKWIKHLRRSYQVFKKNQSTLDTTKHTFTLFTPEREKKLLDLGLTLEIPVVRREDRKEVKTQKWENLYNALKQYKLEHGHCEPKARENASLRSWMHDNREQYINLREGKESTLTTQQIQKLNDLGFEWGKVKKINRTFEERLSELKAYKEENGTTIVPRSYPGGLGKWCAEQRHKHKHLLKGDGSIYTLGQDKKEKLDEIDFTWEVQKSPTRIAPKKNWEERFQDLLRFKQQHGHTVVPQNYPGLGHWVKKNRASYREFKRGERTDIMTQERALRLSEIGFAWEVLGRSARNATSLLLQAEGAGNNESYMDSDDYDNEVYANSTSSAV